MCTDRTPTGLSTRRFTGLNMRFYHTENLATQFPISKVVAPNVRVRLALVV